MASGEDDFGSLFEGMVLIDPTSPSQTISLHDDLNQPIPPPPPDLVPNSPSIPNENNQTPTLSRSHSEPLDENLFSDLTLVVENSTTQSPPTLPSQSQNTLDSSSSFSGTHTTAPEINSSTRPVVSRKKKRGGVRIGYARETVTDSDLNSHPLTYSPSLSPSHFQSSPPSPITIPLSQIESSARTSAISSSLQESPKPSLPSSQDNSHSISLHESPYSHRPAISPAIEEIEKSISDKEVEEVVVSTTALNSNAPSEGDDDAGKGGDTCCSMDDKLELIRLQITGKLDQICGTAASVSKTRKELARRRRKATKNVNLASLKYKELEKELEEACEAEDFERAEKVSENLAAAEKEKEESLTMLRDAEAECDSVDLKIQQLLEMQIAAEEEGIALFEQFAKDAIYDADLVLKNAEEFSSKEMEEWLSSTESLEIKKMELQIQSDLISEARSSLKDSIEHSIEDHWKEKEALSKRREVLREELDELLRLVRLKEAEIAENDLNIQEVEKRIKSVVSGFNEAQSSIDMKYDSLQVALSQLQSEAEAFSVKKKEVDEFLFLEEERRSKLRELASVSANEAKECQELVGLRKVLAASALNSREDKVRLARTEQKFLEEVQTLRHQVSAARASLQEISSTRASIQQEIASCKHRISFVDKRGPELEAEKKVAAAARNFKEAGRIAGEAKTLSIEKESVQNKMDKAISDLETIENEIKDIVMKLQESEGLILSKEKEAALAGYQRLQLVGAAAMAERSAALELGDLEEANIFFAEAETAHSEAAKLKQAYDFELEEIEKTSKQCVSLALIANLAGQQLAEIAASVNLTAR